MGYALLVTTLAGLATALGGLLAVMRLPGRRFMGVSMGFAAGVMVGIGLMDMLPESLEHYRMYAPPAAASLRVISLFLLGMAIACLVGGALPEKSPSNERSAEQSRVLRTALVTAIALLLHNLPEGVLTLFSSMHDPALGLRMALAVGLHNLPEGIAVAAPLYFATHNRKKAFGAAFLSGLAEPLGAAIAYLLAARFLTAGFVNGLLALVAGIMCWVSVFELLPAGFEFDKRGYTTIGFGAGVATMLLGIGVLS